MRFPHDKLLYRQRHKVENMFGKLKDWRRIHTRYDRCAHTFMSAICIAATVIFWINQ
jgi:transposase